MDIVVLGTGTVGRTLAGALADLGHSVSIGTRDPAQTLGRDVGDGTFADWLAEHPKVALVDVADVITPSCDLVVNATSGVASLAALAATDLATTPGVVLLDVANALDFSGGFPPRLAVCNDDSLGEQLQRAYPEALVVKSLNTVNAAVMVAPGDTSIFLAGDDAGAKDLVSELLATLGWRDVIDLGGIAAARGMEMYMPLWLAMMAARGNASFNVRVTDLPG